MKFQDLLQEKDKQRERDNFIQFTRDELTRLSDKQIDHLTEYFHGYTLMLLPQEEIDFFSWLKEKDHTVWQDLWGDDESLYLVSIDLLRQFSGSFSQYPICDLIETPNYWFSAEHIKPKGMETINLIMDKAEVNQALGTEEQFLVGLNLHSTDIWHFCYQNQVPLKEMKKIIDDMVFRGLIVHLPDREDLFKYINL